MPRWCSELLTTAPAPGIRPRLEQLPLERSRPHRLVTGCEGNRLVCALRAKRRYNPRNTYHHYYC